MVRSQSQSSVSHTHTHGPRTTNFSASRGSFGSLETGVRSDAIEDVSQDELGRRRQDEDLGLEDITCQGTEIDDDEGELDSLDEGLGAFHAPSSPRLLQGDTVLPMHDGLGGFGYTYVEGMQEQLWQFERLNPHRRRQRRRSSVHKRLEAMEKESETQGLDRAEERRLRIERWRLGQSKAVLEEIERETRRRQRRMTRISGVGEGEVPLRQNSVVEMEKKEDEEEKESFWQRITRRVIRDLIGLDDTTLSVIFGEELASDLSTTPTQDSPLGNVPKAPEASLAAYPGRTWEHRLLERVARELGILVHELSSHEGAFSTYTPANDMQLSTALPSTSALPASSSAALPIPNAHRHQHDPRISDLGSSDAIFAPTLPQNLSAISTSDSSLWGAEEEQALHNNSNAITQQNAKELNQKQEPSAEYWERDLDVHTIFTYLRDRFLNNTRQTQQVPSRSTPAQQGAADGGPLPTSWTTPAPQPLRRSPNSRADLIKAHHPLVSRAAERSAQRRRESLRRHQALLHHQAVTGSCASQSQTHSHYSAKRSRVSVSSTGGSRRFWDFPGAGTSVGSVVSVGSERGGWGDV